MADLTQTAASVVPGTNAVKTTGTAGEAVSAGMPVYKKAADKKLYKAKKGGTAAESAVIGVAVASAAANQPLVYQTNGRINVGATLTVGEMYAVGAAYGGICPWADVVATNYVTPLGPAISATEINLDIQATGIVHG